MGGKNFGRDGWFYITQQQDELLAKGEDQGAKLWAQVGERFEQISSGNNDLAKVN